MLILIMLVALVAVLELLAQIWMIKNAPGLPTNVSPVMKRFKAWKYDDDPPREYSE